VFCVPFPEVRVLGHPGLAATLLALLTGALAARHRDAAAGVVRGPGDGVVCSDEPGRPAVAGSHPAVGEASVHAFAKPARAGADHSIGADNRAVAGRIADEVVTDRALTASAAAAGASGIADTTAAGWIADTTGAAGTTAADRIADTTAATGAAGATGEAANRNRIRTITRHTAQPAGIGAVARNTTRRTGITRAGNAAGRNRICAAGNAAGRNRIRAVTGNTRIAAVARRPAWPAGARIARRCPARRGNGTDWVWRGRPTRRPTGSAAGRNTGAGPSARCGTSPARGQAGQGCAR